MQQADGKARGVSIIRPGVAPPVHRRPSGPPRSARYGRAPGKLTSSFTSIVARMAVLGVGVFLASTYAKWSTLLSPVEPMKHLPMPAISQPSQFKCDGRTHCSQMSTCEEATYFVENCPNTQMDGDNDGVPCESQLCG
jgi:hypothetical protein